MTTDEDALKQRIAELHDELARMKLAATATRENIEKLKTAHRQDLVRANFQIDQLQRKLSERQPLTWTDKKPAAPGIYLLRETPEADAIPIRVTSAPADDSSGQLYAWFRLKSNVSFDGPLVAVVGQFAGPIAVPDGTGSLESDAI
jgi:hypothetical protein